MADLYVVKAHGKYLTAHEEVWEGFLVGLFGPYRRRSWDININNAELFSLEKARSLARKHAPCADIQEVMIDEV